MSEKLDQIKALREGRAARKNSRGGTVKARAGAVDLPVANEHHGPKGRSGALERSLDRLDVNRASGEPSRQPHHLTVGVASGPRDKPKPKPKPKRKAKKQAPAKPKVGRPRVEDRGKTLTALQPWVTAKMSRATWYRRQAKQ